MTDINQTATEGENALAHEQSFPKMYSVSVTRPIYLLVGFVGLILLLLTPFLWYKYPRAGIACIVLFLAIGLLLRKYKNYFVEKKLLELHTDKLIIKAKENVEISFGNIRDYNIIWTGGVALTILLKNGEKIKLKGNKTVGDAENLVQFVTDFDTAMRQLITSGQLQAKRKKPFIESSAFMLLIVANTILALLGIAMSVHFKKSLPDFVWLCGGISCLYWPIYFYQRNKSKEMS